MQLVTATPFVPRREETRAPGAELAEFCFESEAALERAVALAAAQSWIRSFSVDRTRRALRVTLAAGTAPRYRAVGAAVH
jgi:hypothetical protein